MIIFLPQVLAELLLEREHRERFRRLEGLELMVRMLTNNGYSFYPALRVLDYALAGCRLSCERAVDVSFNMFFKISTSKSLYTNLRPNPTYLLIRWVC
jgi:hypothetical protein